MAGTRSRKGQPTATDVARGAALREADRAIVVVEMKATGRSFAEIGNHFGISRQRAHEVFWDEIRRIGDEHRQYADHAFFEVLEREYLVIRTQADMIMARCLVCQGDRSISIPDGFVPSPLVMLPNARMVCGQCRGSGWQYGPTARSTAAQTIQRSNDAIAKLYGLYAPNRTELTAVEISFRPEVAAMTDEELTREMDFFLSDLNTAAAQAAIGVKKRAKPKPKPRARPKDAR